MEGRHSGFEWSLFVDPGRYIGKLIGPASPITAGLVAYYVGGHEGFS